MMDKQRKVKVNNRRRKELIFYSALIALPFLHYLIFYVLVNINSILLAFKQYTLVNGREYFTFAGFSNFAQFFRTFGEGVKYKIMLRNSLLFYCVGLFIITPLSLIFSYYIFKKFFASEFFRVILFLPAMISAVVTAFMYTFLMDEGLVNLLNKFGFTVSAISMQASTRILFLVIYSLLMGFGSNIIILSNAMSGIDTSVLEYAQIDGVGFFREFTSIVVPLIFDTISTLLIIGVTGIFTNQAGIYVLYGSASALEEIHTFGFHLFILTLGSTSSVNYPYASALGLIFTIILVPITFIVRWALNKINPNEQH
ncbi:MAG: carbohydrate ABC transporter permease [Christensenellaceae bacterium]|nr:sugar ABC transporter permease [Bacillota bacterium]